jgi:hypothetical protein
VNLRSGPNAPALSGRPNVKVNFLADQLSDLRMEASTVGRPYPPLGPVENVAFGYPARALAAAGSEGTFGCPRQAPPLTAGNSLAELNIRVGEKSCVS